VYGPTTVLIYLPAISLGQIEFPGTESNGGGLPMCETANPLVTQIFGMIQSNIGLVACD
jgi:hypothetical protein